MPRSLRLPLLFVLSCLAFQGHADVLPASSMKSVAKQIEHACLAKPESLKAPFVQAEEYPSVCNCIGGKTAENLHQTDLPVPQLNSPANATLIEQAARTAGAACLQKPFRASIEKKVYNTCMSKDTGFAAFKDLAPEQLSEACTCSSRTVGLNLNLAELDQAGGDKAHTMDQLVREKLNIAVLSCIKK